jgi:hypothetical protein
MGSKNRRIKDQTGLSINLRPYLQNNQEKKMLKEWLKWYSTSLASAKPWVQYCLPKIEKYVMNSKVLICKLRMCNPEDSSFMML